MSNETFPGERGAARAYLRDRTREDHHAVDAVYSAFDLSTREGYAAFLRAQAGCVAAIEAALGGEADRWLGDWPARVRWPLLEADLRELGVEPPGHVTAPAFPDEAAMLGGVYVLEGSRMGGAVLRHKVFDGAPLRFLGARGEPRAWRDFLEVLDQRLGTEADRSAAAEAASAVFACFRQAGRRELEPLAVG